MNMYLWCEGLELIKWFLVGFLGGKRAQGLFLKGGCGDAIPSSIDF